MTVPHDSNDLIEELRRRVRDLARQEGRTEDEVLREAVAEYCETHRPHASKRKTAFEAFQEADLVGCWPDAPQDLSTSSDHFEGFGRD